MASLLRAERPLLSFFEMVMLGVALSCDSFAITISNTLVHYREGYRRLLMMPFWFGLFQGLMPVLGFFLGTAFGDIVSTYSGIIALVLLGVIGGNMVREGIGALRRREGADSCEIDPEPLKLGTVIVEAFATAIDAFAVGVSLCAMRADILVAGVVICVVTAAICVVGIAIGRKAGASLGDKAQVFGGVVLICIGIRAFLA